MGRGSRVTAFPTGRRAQRQYGREERDGESSGSESDEQHAVP
jgi:hypothetical protein